MSTTKIEKDGIKALGNFLSKSEIIHDKINEGDKEHSWDGYITLFNKQGHQNRKSEIKGRIPVQVKSTKRKAKENETFSLEKVDLENYLNEGGTLFIRPIFISTVEYIIFVKILLPVDINNTLKNNKPETKSVVIHLEKVDTIKKFEKICHHFINNRLFQRDLESIIDVDSSKFDPNTELIAMAIPEEKVPDSIFSDSCYFYLILNDIKRPINLKINELEFLRQEDISIKGKVYFKGFKFIENRDNSKKIKFNSVLDITFSNTGEVLSLNFKSTDEKLFIDTLAGLRFMVAFNYNVEFDIGIQKFHYSTNSKNKVSERNLKFYEDILIIFERFRIKYDKITNRDINKEIETLKYLLNCFIDNRKVIISDKKSHFLRNLKLFNKDIILLYKFEGDSKFSIHNFIKDDPFGGDYILQVNDKSIPTSRYLAFSIQNLIKITAIDGFFKKVTDELVMYYTSEAVANYEYIMLESIKAFDETNNIEFLNLADAINNLITEDNYQTKELSKDIGLINKFQIIKRKRKLRDDEEKCLNEILYRNPDNLDITCCVKLLLESFTEFRYLFKKMSEQQKETFKKWPIYYLYHR